MEDFVSVSVRIKPIFSEETSSCLQVINKQPAVLLVLERPQTYHFDNIFTEDDNQEDVYNDTVQHFVKKVKAGYNCTVFAYGQTGTGKTYTIGTNPDIKNEEESGLISRTLEEFFQKSVEDLQIEISISFIEIYNEKVFDLLAVNNKIPLPVKGFTVQGFKKVKVRYTSEALSYLKSGNRQRHIGETKQNAGSSRSHAIFSIYCHSRSSEVQTMAKLNLVDLAGSESVKKTGNQGASLYEGININKGLLSLGQVMTALSTNSSHIPYRQSILTTILQDSLNKKNLISLIACVSSSTDDLTETLQTLEFSSRVKKLKNRPEVNEFMTQYKKDNPTLFLNCGTKGLTPSKRANGYSYETPFKKPRNVLPIIQEPFSANNSEISPLTQPLFSSSMTSGISTVSDTPQNFSPVIKRYMAAMENSIVNRLEGFINNTFKRQTRNSSKTDDKENELIPENLFRASDQSTPKRTSCETLNSRTSDDGLSFISKNISTCQSEKNTSSSSPNPLHNNDTDIFKVPAPKIGFTTNKKIRRSSVRLQMKNGLPEVSNSSRRRSVRLQNKRAEEDISTTDVDMDHTSRRRSVRLQMKATTDNIDRETSSNQKRKRLTNSQSSCMDCLKRGTLTKEKVLSPITLHTQKVLDILNKGTLRKLATLHTVGIKTAENILLYRQLNGEFKSVSEIAEIPYWTEKKFQKFLAMNFIKT